MSGQQNVTSGGETVERAMSSVIAMMDRLDAVLKQENEALAKMDRQKFLDLQQEKKNLAKNYELEAQKLNAMREKISTADESLKSELKQSYKNFEDRSDENLKSLKRRGDGVKALNARIVTAAREILVQQREQYDASGKVYSGRANKTVSSGLMDTV